MPVLITQCLWRFGVHIQCDLFFLDKIFAQKAGCICSGCSIYDSLPFTWNFPMLWVELVDSFLHFDWKFYKHDYFRLVKSKLDVRQIWSVSNGFFHKSNGGCKSLFDDESFFTENNCRKNQILPRYTTEPPPSSVMTTHFTRYTDRQTTCVYQPHYKRIFVSRFPNAKLCSAWYWCSNSTFCLSVRRSHSSVV